METILCNLAAAKPQRKTLHGRAYLVAPITIFPPGGGVMNGSKGALHYPDSVVSANIGGWNHIPITAKHPTDNYGKHVSADNPDVLDKQGLGFLLNDRMEDGKRRVDGWFDEAVLRNYDSKNGTSILSNLEAGKLQEVSTGLITQDSPAQNGANHNGREYKYTVTGWQSDHLALLPDQKGACDIKAGCGVFNEEVQNGWTVPEDQKRSIWQKLGEMLGVVVNESSMPVSDGRVCAECKGKPDAEKCDACKTAMNAGRYGNPQSQNTGRYKPHGSGVGKGAAHEAAQSGAMMMTERDMELGMDAKRQLAETGHNPASWVADEATWEKAKAAADKTYSEGDDAYWPAVTHIYKQMGGEVKEKAENAFCATGEGGGVDPSCGTGGGKGAKQPFTEVRDLGKETKGISGFPKAKIDPSQRFQSYVQGVGSKLHGSKEEAEAHIKETLSKRANNEEVANDAAGGETPYPWDQCIADQLKEYGDQKTAEEVCGEIRGANNSDGTDALRQGELASRSDFDDVVNAFCATGEGGGQDNSCSSREGGGDSRKSASADAKQKTTIARRESRKLDDPKGTHHGGSGYTESSSGHSLAAGDHERAVQVLKSENMLTYGHHVAIKAHEEAAAAHRKAADLYRVKANEEFSEIAMFGEVINESGNPDDFTNEGVTPMKLNEKQRTTIVTELTTNCACWKGEDGKAALNEMSDDRLIALAKHHKDATDNALVANAVKETLKPPDDLAANEMPAFLKKKMKGEKPGDSASDSEPDADEDDTMNAEEEKDAKRIAANARKPAKPRTVDEYFSDPTVPEEIKSAARFAMNAERQQKAQIVQQLVTNVEDDKQRERLAGRYMKMTLNDLQDELATRPQMTTNNDNESLGFYFGNVGAVPATTNTKEDPELQSQLQLMETPTVNFEELSKRKTA